MINNQQRKNYIKARNKPDEVFPQCIVCGAGRWANEENEKHWKPTITLAWPDAVLECIGVTLEVTCPDCGAHWLEMYGPLDWILFAND